MKTIVQEYGPIYGEPVNGTVQGRPNGSVFVPSTNIIKLQVDDDNQYLRYNSAGTILIVCQSDGTFSPNIDGPIRFNVSALSQDLASNIMIQVYNDAALTNLVAYKNMSAGLFNSASRTIENAVGGLSAGDTLYLRAQLMNNGTAVATSDVIEMEMVVVS